MLQIFEPIRLKINLFYIEEKNQYLLFNTLKNDEIYYPSLVSNGMLNIPQTGFMPIYVFK